MPVSKPIPKPIPVDPITPPGFRWPEFSPGFRKRWHAQILLLLRGYSGGTGLKAVYYPDGFRNDICFWNEMRICVALAKAYADLGGDRVKGLTTDLVAASSGDSTNPPVSDAFRNAMNAPEVLELALAGVADMRARIGAEPSEWARERLQAAGVSPEQIEEYAAQFAYSKWPGASPAS